MGDVKFTNSAYAKIIIHAQKYFQYAVNGILLADGSKIKEGSKNSDLNIVDTIPLFHHSHYLSPMAEVALTQVEAYAQAENRVIAGYYAGCENFNDNTVEKCPGQKIAEKIVEYFPSAIFVVVDNKKVLTNIDSPAIKIYRFNDGKWKQQDINNEGLIDEPHVLKVAFECREYLCEKLVDFDNYLDDITKDWSNRAFESSIEKIYLKNSVDSKKRH